jgi:PAS domain S-box-containing protein
MSSSLRKNTEEELRASEARYRTFVDHATDAFMLHAEDGTVIDVNPQACDNLGYSRDELIGMTPMEFDPKVSNDLLENINEQLNRGEIVTFESRHRRKDGSEFPVEVRVRPFWHEGRRLNISVVRDISDRKRAEEAVRRSERELRELIETIPAMAFVIGRDGSSEFVSRQWIEFSGVFQFELPCIGIQLLLCPAFRTERPRSFKTVSFCIVCFWTNFQPILVSLRHVLFDVSAELLLLFGSSANVQLSFIDVECFWINIVSLAF